MTTARSKWETGTKQLARAGMNKWVEINFRTVLTVRRYNGLWLFVVEAACVGCCLS